MSVGNAIRIGVAVVNGPIAFIMIGGFIVSAIIINSPLALPLGLVGGFVAAWLWWSFSVVKWRAWAYRNVKAEDIARLKKEAIRVGLTWPDDSVFKKTEIKSKQEQATELEIEKITHAEMITEKSPAQKWQTYVAILIGAILLSILF